MFQSLRANNQLYILHKDAPKLEMGTVVSVSPPTPKYMQPIYGQAQEMVVDLTVSIDNQEIKYQKLPANQDIADFGNTGIVISDSREAMNSEVMSLKKRSSDIIDSIDYHRNVIAECEGILSTLNPEFAEKQAQRREIDELRNKIDELIQQLKQNNYENVGNKRE